MTEPATHNPRKAQYVENQLYTVTLTDLGTFTADVVANSPEEATAIAKEQLWAAYRSPAGFKTDKRETDGKAEIAARQPYLMHSVSLWYQVRCAYQVPATTETEAKEHVRRLIELNGPFDSMSGENRLGDMTIEQSVPNGGPRNA